MEIQDGFIVSIFNYCDRWCERCPLTSRCRVFAISAEEEFEADHGPLTEPIAVDLAEIQREVDNNPTACEPADIKFEHLELEVRAQDFMDDLWSWFKSRDLTRARADAVEVLHHFGFFVPSKIHRALQGFAEEDEPLESDSDVYGSAKAALLGLEDMHKAWQQLIRDQFITPDEVAPLVNETQWLIDEIDRVIPQARAFTRPGFDEPDEVRKLAHG